MRPKCGRQKRLRPNATFSFFAGYLTPEPLPPPWRGCAKSSSASFVGARIPDTWLSHYQALAGGALMTARSRCRLRVLRKPRLMCHLLAPLGVRRTSFCLFILAHRSPDLLFFLPLPAPRSLCRRVSSQHNLILLKVALHLHNQHVYLFRHGQRRRAELRELHKPCLRRNGWVVKPRQGDPGAKVVEDKWWRDNSKSPYWEYFKSDASYNERSAAGYFLRRVLHALGCLRPTPPHAHWCQGLPG